MALVTYLFTSWHCLHDCLCRGIVYIDQLRHCLHVGQDMVTKLLKMQMLSDDDELAYSPDSAR